jgi:hypothetical protein
MTWNVRFRVGTVDRLAGYPNPEKAIEAACRLIGDGCDVHGIETEPLSHSIGREIITRIYGIWMREKSAFSQE